MSLSCLRTVPLLQMSSRQSQVLRTWALIKHFEKSFSTTDQPVVDSAKPFPVQGNSVCPTPAAKQEVSSRMKKVLARRNYRFAFPEFLPDPDPTFRNKLAEFLNRKDMIKRREKVDIPEFYVGSVVRVVMADPNSASVDKTTPFTGIVIDRGGTSMRAWFIVRNVVDGQGVEMMYRMYSPNIVRIETLKLEMRLDDELYYLRDCAPEYSTFPLDSEAELLPDGLPVPLNDLVVPLRSPPWSRRWEKFSDRLKGFSYEIGKLNPERKLQKKQSAMFLNRSWQLETVKYDLMRTYRRTIPVEEQDEIWEEVGDVLEMRDKEMKRAAVRRALIKSGNVKN